MPRRIRIDHPDDPRIAEYLNVRDPHLRAAEHALPGAPPDTPPAPDSPDTPGRPGLFMAEGEVVLRHLLRSRFPVRSVLAHPARLDALSALLALLPESTPLYAAEPPVMDAIAGFNIHRGVLAVGLRAHEHDPDGLIASAGPGRPLVVLEDLTNHDNIGGIFRSAAAFGAAGILLSPRCADPLYRKALRVSVGLALTLPFARLTPWPEGLDRLRSAGVFLAALALRDGAIPLETLAASPVLDGRPVALLVGTEGAGLTAPAMARSDATVVIPIDPGVDSLSATVAASVALSRFGRPTPR